MSSAIVPPSGPRTPLPEPRWASGDRARALRASDLVERVLGADDAALLELALLGVEQAVAGLAPLLADLPSEPVALRDEEGVLRAVVEQARLEGVDPPAHADALDLRLPPAGPPPQLRGALALVVPGALAPATLDAARGLAVERGAPLVVLLGPDGLGPDGAAAAVRAARALLAPDGGAVRLLRLPVPPSFAASDAVPLLVGAAGVLGASVVAVPGPAGQAVTAAARHAGLELRDGLPDDDVLGLLRRGEDVPGLPVEAAEALRLVAPPAPSTGLCVFFTGLSGSGKSTVAQALVAQLREVGGRRVTVLDGDVVRHHLSRGLTFSREDRDTNVERIGFVGSVVAGHGGAAVCAPIAPFDVTRKRARAMVEASGVFVLVHVATPLEVCEARDRKGLYAKARAGQIPAFTGVSDPYEAPDDAEVVVDTSQVSAVDAASQVLAHLHGRGLLA